jgi:hypothetical protein
MQWKYNFSYWVKQRQFLGNSEDSVRITGIFNCHDSRICYIKQSASGSNDSDVNRRITEIIQQKDAITANLHESLSWKITAPLRKVHGRLFG